jgi:COMPASS component SWD3
MTGGWDSTIHIWDTREGKSIKHMYGPHISGESIDFQDGKILAGCYSPTNQIQIWDLASAKKIEEIDWTGNIDEAEYIYTASFNKRHPGTFAAGSTGANSEVRMFAKDENNKYQVTNQIKGLN